MAPFEIHPNPSEAADKHERPSLIHHVQDFMQQRHFIVAAHEVEKKAEPLNENQFVPVDQPKFKGSLYLIGGGADSTLVALSKRLAKGDKLACIPFASNLPNAAELDADSLVKAGIPAKDIVIILAKGQKPPTNKYKCSKDIPQSSNVVFFGGGDQKDLHDRTDQAQLDAVKKILANGGILAGTSAGTAVMSSEMITGGKTSKTLTHSRGFGLVPWAVMDTHVHERNREARDITALYDVGKGLPVVGLDPDTAVDFHWKGNQLIGEISGKGTARVFTHASAAPLDVSRSLMPKVMETDDGTHREANVWELKAGDTFVVPTTRPKL